MALWSVQYTPSRRVWVSLKLAHFLFKYRITPRSSTGISPAELMFGHHLWFSLIIWFAPWFKQESMWCSTMASKGAWHPCKTRKVQCWQSSVCSELWSRSHRRVTDQLLARLLRQPILIVRDHAKLMRVIWWLFQQPYHHQTVRRCWFQKQESKVKVKILPQKYRNPDLEHLANSEPQEPDPPE